jgi:hypothetical protein
VIISSAKNPEKIPLPLYLLGSILKFRVYAAEKLTSDSSQRIKKKLIKIEYITWFVSLRQIEGKRGIYAH